ncbi:MAG: radical SAM protein [Candidatus Omnitrophica bacterium]|nr:radical SAM protein [Candidatus Omnitrophota bacterium]
MAKILDKINLKPYYFLATLSREENYPPLDSRYLSFDYGENWDIEKVCAIWKKTLRLIQKKSGINKNVGLYIHWPFCSSHCSFCFCDVDILASKNKMQTYFRLLRREIISLRDIFSGVAFDSLFIGGGTPTFIPNQILENLLKLVHSTFQMKSEAQFYIEATPTTLTPGKIRILKHYKVNRLTFGIQSLDPKVLAFANRKGQTRQCAENAISMVRRELNAALGLDLIAGLEGQTQRSFLDDLFWAIRMQPEMLHIYHFDPRSNTPYASLGRRVSISRNTRTRSWLHLADEILSQHGFRQARAVEDEGLLRSFEVWQDVAARWWNASILGIGANALSHAYGSAWYCHLPVASFIDEPLSFKGVAFEEEEEVRGFVIFWLETKRLFSRRMFKELFGRDVLEVPPVSVPLRDLEKSGKVRITQDCVISLMKDPAERLVWFKHFYSKRIVKRLLAVHRSKYEIFCERQGIVALEDLAKTKYMQHRYYNCLSDRYKPLF